MRLFLFYLAFCRIGLFAVGGGLATLPFLFEMADAAAWLSREAVGDMLAVAQSLPGAIGVNLAAYTGFRFAGPAGGVLAALGLITAPVAVIIAVARALGAFRENRLVKAVFAGFRPAAAGLLSSAGAAAIALSLYDQSASSWLSGVRWKELCLFAALFFFIVKFKKHPVVYIAAAAAAGAALGL